MPRSLLLLALLTLTPAVFAVDGPSTAKMPLDFELSDGHRFVTLAALPALPTVVTSGAPTARPASAKCPSLPPSPAPAGCA